MNGDDVCDFCDFFESLRGYAVSFTVGVGVLVYALSAACFVNGEAICHVLEVVVVAAAIACCEFVRVELEFSAGASQGGEVHTARLFCWY